MINRISTLIFSSILISSFCAIGSAAPLLLQGRAGTGVTAEVLNYALNGNIFSFTIENTSISPGTTGTITNIGFDLPGQITASSLIETSGVGHYSLANSVAANATGLNTILDFALLTQKSGGSGVSNGFNGGFVASGIGPGSLLPSR